MLSTRFINTYHGGLAVFRAEVDFQNVFQDCAELLRRLQAECTIAALATDCVDFFSEPLGQFHKKDLKNVPTLPFLQPRGEVSKSQVFRETLNMPERSDVLLFHHRTFEVLREEKAFSGQGGFETFKHKRFTGAFNRRERLQPLL